ncbi:MAG: hypothetical protein QM658_02700 [Gordonia sp. (in: high G+C Gram-positive bacteria)]
MTAALALALVVGTTTACSSSDSSGAAASSASTSKPPNVYEKQRQDGVQKVLDALGSAVQSGDTGKLDKLFDPLAAPEFRNTFRQMQQALGQAPKSAAGRGSRLRLKTFDYQVAPDDSSERQLGGELAVKLSDAGSTDSWVAPVKLNYALGGAALPGVDEPEISLSSYLVFTRYDDDWKLLGGEELAPDPSLDPTEQKRPPELGPWAFDGVAAADAKTAGGDSAVLSYPDTDRTATSIRKQFPAAVAAVTAFWGDDWPRKAVVTVTGTDAQFAGFTRTAPGTTAAAAAATVYSRIDKASKTVVGQRVVFSPAARELSDAGIGVVLRHELTHVAARLQTADGAPMWLTEGVAEYVGRKGSYQKLEQAAPDLAAQVAAGDVPTVLPSDSEFGVDDDTARIAYQTAWSFAAYIAGKYDEKHLKAMYLAVAKGGDSAKIDAALRQTIGKDKKALVADWGAWLRGQVR